MCGLFQLYRLSLLGLHVPHVGKGIVDASVVDRHNIRTLFGAGAWDFILVLRVPTSSSHALMGG